MQQNIDTNRVAQNLMASWQASGLKQKLLFTFAIIALFRLGAQLPIYGINNEVFQALAGGNNLIGFLDMFSGGALGKVSIFALGIGPYITSSIIMQLLAVVVPKWEQMQKEDGEAGRRKIDKITRIMTVALAVITAVGYFFLLRQGGFIYEGGAHIVFKAIVMVACFTAGSALIMWLGEKIDEQGIGNGISMILFANIVSGIPGIASTFITSLQAEKDVQVWLKWVLGILTLLIVVGSLIFVTYMSDAERRIPVQYAKRVVGRKMYGGQNSNLPIKLNMSGVMPIIFASTIVSFIPTVLTIVEYFTGAFKEKTFWYVVKHLFDADSALYIILLFVLIIAFAYFYISISFNPVEVSNNLMQQGGFIPGIRPGKPTVQYIKKVLNKVILMGAFILGLIACIPLILNAVSGGLLGVVSFSGSTLLIVVGVILETVRELEAQMTMRHYKGFLE